MHRLIYLLLISVISTAAGAQGQTSDALASRMIAISCEKLPTPLAIDVQALDNAERFVKFKGLFEKELRAKGVKLSSTATTTATLDVRTVREFKEDAEDLWFEKRFGREGADIFQDSTLFRRGNVWSNKGASLFGGPEDELPKFSLNQL